MRTPSTPVVFKVAQLTRLSGRRCLCKGSFDGMELCSTCCSLAALFGKETLEWYCATHVPRLASLVAWLNLSVRLIVLQAEVWIAWYLLLVLLRAKIVCDAGFAEV